MGCSWLVSNQPTDDIVAIYYENFAVKLLGKGWTMSFVTKKHINVIENMYEIFYMKEFLISSLKPFKTDYEQDKLFSSPVFWTPVMVVLYWLIQIKLIE